MAYTFRLNERALRDFEDRELRRYMASLQRDAVDYSKDFCPYDENRTRPGAHTRDTIEGSITPRGVRPISIDVSAGGAAEFINEGTRPHDIPSGGRRSVLFNSAGIFGPVTGPVNHPGTAPNPFLRRGMALALVRHGLRPINP